MDIVHTETHQGCRIEVWQDPDCESPREWGNIEKLYTWEQRYHSIDEVPFSGKPDSLEDALTRLREQGEIVYFKFISKYEHSGVIYRMGSPRQFPDSQWDAGYVGLAVVYKSDYETCCEPWTGTSEQIERCREAIVSGLKQYTDWCNGHCFGFTAYDWNDDVIASCGGYIGDHDEALKEAIEEVTGHVTTYKDTAAIAAVAGV